MSAFRPVVKEEWLWGPLEPLAEYYVRRAPWLSFHQAITLLTLVESLSLTPRHIAEMLNDAERCREVNDLNDGGFEWVMEEFIIPWLVYWRATPHAGGRPDGRPPGGQVHDIKQRSGRARRRGQGGRR